MTLSISTNIAAMTAQRYVGINANQSTSSLAKLSSGSRVPQAKDDAAALAIGSQLRAEVTGLNQAAQNATQGVSLLQIADGALATIGDILVRMQSLANQASSGQIGSSERVLLDLEFEELKSEITRISNDTNFNGTQLLQGTAGTVSTVEAVTNYLAQDGISLSFNQDELDADASYAVTYDFDNTGNDTGVMTIKNLTTGESQSVDVKAIVQAVTGEANTAFTTNLSATQSATVNFDALGVTVTLDDKFNVDADYVPTASIDGTTVFNTNTLGDVTYGAGADVMSAADMATLRGLAAFDTATGILALNVDSGGASDDFDILATAGLEFSVNGGAFAANIDNVATTTASTLAVRLTSNAQELFTVDIAALTSTDSGDTTGTIDVDLNGLFRATETAGTDSQFNFRVGTGNVDANDLVQVTITSVTLSALSLGLTDIGDSQTNAGTALDTIASAITTVSSRRAEIGANQSRLEFAANSINVAIENTAAAQSSLLDVDVSMEMTEFTSKQVLLQAGISMLAQANQQPSLLLRLLQ